MEKLPIKLSDPDRNEGRDRARPGRRLRRIHQGWSSSRNGCSRAPLSLRDWVFEASRATFSEGAFEAALVWGQAERAAEEAACVGWSQERSTPHEPICEIIFDPEAQFADRDTALAMLRKIAEKGERNERDGTLGLERGRTFAGPKEGRLVDNLTIAFSTLSMASYYPADQSNQSAGLPSRRSTP